MEKVRDILEHVCPCGGDPSFPMHQESLLHRKWLLGQAIPDALSDPDTRSLREIQGHRDPHELRHQVAE